ncbi:potassium channel family protein [Desulfospira joergensenii]|uniref:potassium channel family protein n=1 Tax=Desulfospira joergensenii TaxID=53329 RepID=UPI0003B69FFE|nr:potassium channel family protein [Desulfospira joergensenii]
MIEKNKIRFRIYSAAIAVLLSVGIIGFMFIENMSLTDAIYFSIVTMATVGYGDLHPQTDIGKILTLIIIICGVGTFLGVIASITDLFVNRREESLRRQKLDMVTGLFFSEMGSELLKRFTRITPEAETLHAVLRVSDEWKDKDFDTAYKVLKKSRFTIDSRGADITELSEYLQNRADLLLRLIENPIIQEHENFSELLLAVFHLRDELLNRSDISKLPDSDRIHLEGDMVRVYRLLIFEWLRYIRYLKESYGYLFSLAMRVNPFDPEADAVVKNS